MQRGVDWLDALRCRARRIAYEWVETVGAGARKSVCFWGLLRWSVGRHGLLRSRCTHSRQRCHRRQSAVVLIAFWGLHDPSWRWRASPGLSSIPVQGEPQGSWIGISALDPVALMGRKQQMIPWTEIHNPIGVLQRNTGTPPQHKHPLVIGLIHPFVTGGAEAVGGDQQQSPCFGRRHHLG